MINLPKLDDQLYKDIINTAREKISKLIPEWTDYNIHDPGITLIELLSWLKEMQQYHLDRITDKNRQKFLKLLGIKLKSITPAQAKIFLEKNSREFILPEKSRFSSGNILYETADKLWLNTCPVKKIIVYDGSNYTDVSNAQEESKISFYAFGEKQKAGSAMYIGYEKPFPVNSKFSLWIDLFDQYPVPRNAVNEGISIQLNKVEWETAVNGEWVTIDKVTDRTSGLLYEGYIEFEFNSANKMRITEACEDELYWIRARLIQPGCEESPKIKKIYNNLVFANQAYTLSEIHEIELDSGQGQLQLETYLSLFGKMDLQIGQKDGTWRFVDIDSDIVTVHKDFDNAVCSVSINSAGNFSKLRVICYEALFEPIRIIGSSNQMPHQRFSLRNFDNILREDVLIQISEVNLEGELVWKDWVYTDELDVAESKSRCFTIDSNSGELVFGDSENGLIPPAGTGNIVIISCRTSHGSAGNINKGEINNMPDMNIIAGNEAEKISCYNISDCIGGADDETVDMAISRLKEKLATPQRAVTTNDYENIAKRTPGLRIARVKAVPSQEKDYSNVRIVVMPYSLTKHPSPNEQFIEAVKKHMEQYRLIGSSIEIIEPHYIEISIYAEIVPSFTIDNPQRDIIEKIDSYLSLDGESADGSRRNFGDPVFESDIISLINSLDCVSYVKRVIISARGNGWKKAKGGDIYIPFNSMVTSGHHEINLQDR